MILEAQLHYTHDCATGVAKLANPHAGVAILLVIGIVVVLIGLIVLAQYLRRRFRE